MTRGSGAAAMGGAVNGTLSRAVVRFAGHLVAACGARLRMRLA